MDKLTPESFGQVHMHRVERELEAYPLPVRMKMIEGVQGALDGLRYRIHDRLNPQPLESTPGTEAPDPDLKTPEPLPDPTQSTEASSPQEAGAEATSAPGEPGTVSPTGGPLETPG